MDNTQLERDIFGGSDSELSSEGEQRQKAIKSREVQPKPRPPNRSFSPVGSPESDAEDDSEAKDGSYVQDLRAALPKFKKSGSKKSSATMDGSKAVPKRRKKAAREPSPGAAQEEEEKIPLDPEELRKRTLENRIDSAGKLGKSRPKKRKKGDEDALDEANDTVVARLKHMMKVAADEDHLANANRQPATAKLRLLPEVTQVLQRTQLTQAIIDGNLLELVKVWLEPLPDKSLPALNIQHSFFEVLPKMDIDTVALKESGLGRIVLFYTKPNKRVTQPIKRAADALVAQWSRPIIKRSASYRDRVIPTAQLDPTTGERRPLKLSQVLQKQREEDAAAGITGKRNAVRIPERNFGTYTVAPRNTVSSQMSARMVEDMKSRKAQNDRARKVHRHLTQHAAKLQKQ